MSDRTFAYQPGGWYGIVGEHATVLLPGTEKTRAGALWVLVDDGAGFDAVLDALVAGGLTSLPGFVLLASDEDTTRVVVRGDAVAAFDAAEGTVRVTGGGAMWSERTVHAVSRLVVELPGELPGGPRLSVTEGLVRVSGLECPATPAAPRLEVVRGPLPGELPDEPAPEPYDAPEEEPDRAGEEAPGDGGPLGPPPSWTPPTSPPPAPPVGLPTVVPPAPPAPPAPPLPPVPPPPEAPPVAAEDWDDQLTEQLPAMPQDEPYDQPDDEPEEPEGLEGLEEPEEPEEPGWERPGPVAHLSFSSGDEIDVDGLVVIGRAPDAGRFPADEEPRLVPVPSPHSEISATHVEVRPGTGADLGSAVVTDLGSTNGTLVVQPGQRAEELRPGVPVVLQVGALVDLGDGLTIRVTEV